MILVHSRFFVLASFLIAPSISLAQALVSPALQATPKEEPAPVNELIVHAADQPDPLLRYRLWPEPGVRKSENAAPLVSRAVILELQVPAEVQKRFADRFQDWNEMPIDELLVGEVRALIDSYRSALHELQRSENLMRTDYSLQLDELSAAELVQTLLPELQEMRNLA